MVRVSKYKVIPYILGLSLLICIVLCQCVYALSTTVDIPIGQHVAENEDVEATYLIRRVDSNSGSYISDSSDKNSNRHLSIRGSNTSTVSFDVKGYKPGVYTYEIEQVECMGRYSYILDSRVYIVELHVVDSQYTQPVVYIKGDLNKYKKESLEYVIRRVDRPTSEDKTKLVKTSDETSISFIYSGLFISSILLTIGFTLNKYCHS